MSRQTTADKNVVLVTLDCVRADHLGCYGYLGTDTPSIDRIASEGVLFEQAFCQAPNTWVSHASILTGCYPNRHGLRHHLARINRQIPALASVLRDAGYATAGFPAHSLVGRAGGFQRGFDLFDEEDMLFDSSMGETLRQNRTWEPTIEKAFEWILAQEKPFFLWLHYMGTHWEPVDSLTVPEELRYRYSPLGQFYDAKIAYADQVCVGHLYSFLEMQGLLDETVLCITADHGEGDLKKNDPPYRGEAHNKGLEDPVMHVPLVIRAPDTGVSAGQRVQQVVRLVDIVPTILALLGIEWKTLDLDGVDLVCRCEPNEPGTSQSRAYMENIYRGFAGARTDDWKLTVRIGKPEPPRRSVFHRVRERIAREIRKALDGPRPSSHGTHKYSTTDWQKLETIECYAVSQVDFTNKYAQERVPLEGELAELENWVMEMARKSPQDTSDVGPSEERLITSRLRDLGYL